MQLNRQTLAKNQILRQRAQITQLFSQGKTVLHYPIKAVIYLNHHNQQPPIQTLFLVPKRLHKHAVTRNLIRRKIKEAFRLSHSEYSSQLESLEASVMIAFSYVAKENSTYHNIDHAIRKILAHTADLASGSTR